MRAVIFESDAAANLCKDGVVLAEPGIQSGSEAAPSLADDDRSTRDEIAVMRLDAQPLRIRIAAVSRAALSFFMSHCRVRGRLATEDAVDAEVQSRLPAGLSFCVLRVLRG